MAEAEAESLESLLNKATSPMCNGEDWDLIMKFCDHVNNELEGSITAVGLLVHKITSPQEKEALLGLACLEACVKNCGRNFHAEIGKFRFLNEMIKIISPKYLGAKRSEKVKKRCVELMYAWTKGLPHESKMGEAYQMLKRQGVVKQDPTYIDKRLESMAPPPDRPRNAVFEDEEKSKILARLLKSKHPEDLQAANRLIKNMVKQDVDRTEKIAKRVTEVETVNNNVRLLKEMLTQYNASYTTASEKDVMKELYETLDKHRPNLFRLASDTDDKDDSAIADILAANDALMSVMTLYKKLIPDDSQSTNGETAAPSGHDSSALVDLGFDAGSKLTPKKQLVSSTASILENDLACLGLADMGTNEAATAQTQNTDSKLDELGDIFASVQNPSTNTMAFSMTSTTSPFQANFSTNASFPNQTFVSANQPQLSYATAAPGLITAPGAPSSQPAAASKSSALDDLNMLGQNLLQQSLPADKQLQGQVPATSISQKIPMNQLKSQQAGAALSTQGGTLISQTGPMPSQPLNTVASSGGTTASPSLGSLPQPATPELLSLKDIFVPLQTIKPSSVPAMNAYDKGGIKIVIHFGRDNPKPHIIVMVVSIMSMNASPVKNLEFQAAVPKLMKVKLQPPSAIELPSYNPILPPSAITQVMLLANPQKEKIRLKFKLSYVVDDHPVSEVGEMDSFPVQ
ncbi:ADP-ribosylation factor-binding protein GGA1-like isoform X2 [Lineus longissimus]|uniref:ADP-ribosylation factor-binding protein GGA1-like isoform X2 n=1 Tax=Lineus longissimus TaxID=88925 RepID=UPI002B4C677B